MISQTVLTSSIGYEVSYAEFPHGYDSNFPKRPHIFVNREVELSKILRYLSPVAPPRGILIYGQGGVGKTTVALEAAYRSYERRDFDELLFLTAKVAYWDLENRQGIVKQRHGKYRFASFKGMLHQLQMILGFNRTKLHTATDERTILANIKEKLTDRRILFVIDNLDSINNLMEITKFVDFVNFGLPPGNKAVITSREGSIRGYAFFETELKPFGLQTSYSLLSALAAEQEVQTPLYQYENFLDESQGFPIVIQQIASLIAQHGADKAFELLEVTKRKGFLDYLYQTTFSQLSDESKKVIKVIAVATFPVTKQFIMRVLKISPSELDSALSELDSWSLLIKRGAAFDVHYLLEDFVVGLLRSKKQNWLYWAKLVQEAEMVF